MIEIIEKIKHHSKTLSLFFTAAVNLLYISANLLSGLFYHSIWYFSFTLCHIILLAARIFLFTKFKEGKPTSESKYPITKTVGLLLFVLNSLVLTLSVYSLITEKGIEYGKGNIIIFAVYSVYTLLLSLFEILISKKGRNAEYLSYRSITFFTALISLYNLTYSALHNGMTRSAVTAVAISFCLSGVFSISLLLSVFLFNGCAEGKRK